MKTYMEERLERLAPEIAAWLEQGDFGPLRLISVAHRVEADSDGYPSLYLDVTLANPAAGRDTWPIEDVLAMRLAVRAQANELGLEAPVYVVVRPETTEEPEEADSDEAF